MHHRLVRDGDRYLLKVDGAQITEVYRARVRSDRYPYESPTLARRGRWRWHAGNIADEDFATRHGAVTEVLRRLNQRQEAPTP